MNLSTLFHDLEENKAMKKAVSGVDKTKRPEGKEIAEIISESEKRLLKFFKERNFERSDKRRRTYRDKCPEH